ncbi:MAG TPA: UxaA family hydrolase, partial [Acidobacteriota bacterium]|nr:UxaA family hydrolase [Acidobacteriota bacterium]
MEKTLSLEAIARLPHPDDNCAVAVKALSAGQQVDYRGQRWVLRRSILEGHRFAVTTIAAGQPLLSWGLPFGRALRAIEPGEYVCNELVLKELALRKVLPDLPEGPNFADYDLNSRIEPGQIQVGQQVAPAPFQLTFEGFDRGARGVGTRNYIVLLGVTSQASSLVRRLEQRLVPLAGQVPGVDGIVAVAHTEGGAERLPHNLDLLLRTLSGFAVHPNVGAVLIVDRGNERVNHQLLK